MQTTINLNAGERQRMEVRGRQFVIVQSSAPAVAVEVTFRRRGQEVETVRAVGRGFRFSDPEGYDELQFKADSAVALEILATDSNAEFDFFSGGAVLVDTMRGSPGNLLYVSGVTVADAPATGGNNGAAVAASQTIATIATANAARKQLRITNLGPDPVAVGLAGLTWAARCIVLEVGDTWKEDRAANLAWHAITDTGKSASVTWQGIEA